MEKNEKQPLLEIKALSDVKNGTDLLKELQAKDGNGYEVFLVKISSSKDGSGQREYFPFPDKTIGFVNYLKDNKKNLFITAICDLEEFLIGEYENVYTSDLKGLPYLPSFLEEYPSEEQKGLRIYDGEIKVYVLPGICRFFLCLKKDIVKSLAELQQKLQQEEKLKKVKFFKTAISIFGEENYEGYLKTYLLKDKLFLYDYMSIKDKIFRLFLSGRTFPIYAEKGKYKEKYYVFFINGLECVKAFLGKKEHSSSSFKGILDSKSYIEATFENNEVTISEKNKKFNSLGNEENGLDGKTIESVLNDYFVKEVLKVILKKTSCIVVIVKDIYIKEYTGSYSIVKPNEEMAGVYVLFRKEEKKNKKIRISPIIKMLATETLLND